MGICYFFLRTHIKRWEKNNTFITTKIGMCW